MAQTRSLPPKIDPAEYLAGEEISSVRHEFVDGRVYAMSGATERHSIVKLNIINGLFGGLAQNCRLFDGDMKLMIESHKDVRYYYPDIFVACGAGDLAGHFRKDATLIIEVLSRSTERTDRSEKFDAYTFLPMLEEYVLAAQDIPSVEVFRRRTGWASEVYGPGESVTFESVGATLTIAQIYRWAGVLGPQAGD